MWSKLFGDKPLCEAGAFSIKGLLNAATKGAIRRLEVNEYIAGKYDTSKYTIKKFRASGRAWVAPKND